MADAYLKQSDTLPALTGSLLNPDLSPVDLTSTTITLELVQMGNVTDAELAGGGGR
jgi:hypothetical protein